jgi:hypothetical protein
MPVGNSPISKRESPVMKANHSRHMPVIMATFAFVVLAIYVGSYLLLLEVETPSYSLGRKYAAYRVGGTALQYIFRPLEIIDHSVRPAHWREALDDERLLLDRE